ncbi:hypothetical protein [Geobacter sp. DSM 9736]|uniref:hypothetical protein n=1 Tax=Geobacter sp. DSM 9736 TaxID=1277350 RepID=UPI000B5103CC|nr:hypothetical protein [Geobacter sp. DSM 9736]SNB47141.1 hypothetical protein SAMN06269301_2617 [Geobacter sp. DSM 9736]
MRLSLNFSNRAFSLTLLLSVICLVSGCAGARGSSSEFPGTLRVAVLPVENLSGTAVPLPQIRSELLDKMSRSGITLCNEDSFLKFLASQRVRYTGGIDEEMSRALKEQLGVDAVLVTSLELYTEDVPPKIGLLSRLVATGESNEILWMKSVPMTGDEEPGILNLGYIIEPAKLRDKALTALVQSMAGGLAAKKEQPGVSGRFLPKVAFNAIDESGNQKPVIVVLPFVNQSMRKNAGEIQVLHFVKQLVDTGAFRVVEPGIVRNKMLRMRIIMEEGVALPQVDLIALDMKADLILTGKVFEYQDYIGGVGKPKVDFSVQLFDGAGKKIVWASKSYNAGDDGVFFYDWGRTYTAAALTEKMTQAVVNGMLKGEWRRDGSKVSENPNEKAGHHEK